VLDSHVLRELRTLEILMLLHAKMRTEALKHLNDPCRAALGEKVHLQIEMIAAMGDYPHAVLFH